MTSWTVQILFVCFKQVEVNSVMDNDAHSLLLYWHVNIIDFIKVVVLLPSLLRCQICYHIYISITIYILSDSFLLKCWVSLTRGTQTNKTCSLKACSLHYLVFSLLIWLCLPIYYSQAVFTINYPPCYNRLIQNYLCVPLCSIH